MEGGASKPEAANSVFDMFSSIVFALLDKPPALVASPPLATLPLALGFFGVLLVLLIGGALYFQKKRSDRLEATARALGFTFRRWATKEDKALIVGSHLAKAGYARTVHNVLQASGPAELAMFLFDYSYAVGHIKDDDRTIGQTIIRMHSPLLRLPPFSILPENTFSEIGKFFAYPDINFSEDSEFSRNYLLRGPDEAAVRQLFNSSIIRFFEHERDLTVEAAGDLMFLYRYNKVVMAQEMRTFVDTGKQALALLLQAQPEVA
jgi:hypothetical protein